MFSKVVKYFNESQKSAIVCCRDCVRVHVTCLLSLALAVPEYRHVTLGAAVGKVASGSHTTAGFKEDKRNKATPGTKTEFKILILRAEWHEFIFMVVLRIWYYI